MTSVYNTKVSELESLLPKHEPSPVQVRLENVEVDETGHFINVTEDHFAEEQDPKVTRFSLDELSEKELSKFLGVPFKYIENCPGQLKAINLNFWLQANAESSAVFSVIDGRDINAVYTPDKVVLPTSRVAEIIPRVFEADDTIHTFHTDDRTFQMDITSERWQVDVPGNGVLDRPAVGEVGDITSGGIRLYVPTNLKEHKPVVSTFLNRLVCTNGMVLPSTDQVIQLKGQTIDDILEEMENAAGVLLSGLDEHLDNFRKTAETAVPGNYLAFLRQVGQDHGISRTVIDRALDWAAAYGQTEWTVYDALNLFTSLANRASFVQANKLQRFGGHMIDHTAAIVHRCQTCERVIPDRNTV